MALRSMTGFARTEAELGDIRFVWEIKTVNSRGLEMRLRLPSGLDRLDPEIRALTRDHLGRGSCQLSLQFEHLGRASNLVINKEALAAVTDAARHLAMEPGIDPPSADGLLAIRGVLEERGLDGLDEGDGVDRTVLDALAACLVALVTSRAEEGSRLAAILRGHLDRIEQLTGTAADLAAKAPEALFARLTEQVARFTGDASLDPQRLHQEIALLATKADIREETDRLAGHVTAARKLLTDGGVIGRRLDFLAQEFNREANTLCAKSFDKELTALGLELKAVIDQLREQVQNLE
ncbi:MAG: YicC family protein [Alphaproteobacteria bacterium]|nr:MAG: YicC family protein [Alphaproteobacteria bacterium]